MRKSFTARRRIMERSLHVDTVASASRKTAVTFSHTIREATSQRLIVEGSATLVTVDAKGKVIKRPTSVAVDVPVAHSSVAAPSHGVGCPLVCLRRRAILSRPLFPSVIPDLIGDPVICLFFCHQAIPVRRQGHASWRFSPSPSGRGQGVREGRGICRTSSLLLSFPTLVPDILNRGSNRESRVLSQVVPHK